MIINCQYCGSKISDTMDCCPNCSGVIESKETKEYIERMKMNQEIMCEVEEITQRQRKNNIRLLSGCAIIILLPFVITILAVLGVLIYFKATGVF